MSSMDRPRSRSPRVGRRWLGGAAVGISLVAIATLFLGFEPAAPSVDERTLMIDAAERGTFVMEVRGPGTLVPERVRWVTALTAGRVEQRFLEAGHNVEANTVILQLSNPDVELEALEAERQLTAARAQLLTLRTQIEEQRLNQLASVASAKAAHNKAVRDAQAAAGLVAKSMMSSLEASEKQGRAAEMKTRLAAEKQRLSLVESTEAEKLALSREQVDRLREIAEFQRARVASMTVRAGAAGLLQDTSLEIGQWVQPGQTLAKIAEPRGLKAVLKIPETLARDIMLGQTATIDTRNGVVVGRVFRIDPNVQNGAVPVHVRLEGELPRGARSDLSVEGSIETARAEDVLRLARPAYSQADGTLALFVLDPDGRGARRANVRLGRVSSNSAEITSGLSPGDRVIVSDMSRWDSFDRIEIE